MIIHGESLPLLYEGVVNRRGDTLMPFPGLEPMPCQSPPGFIAAEFS